MKRACLFAFVLFPVALFAQFQSFPISDKIPEEAICYCLPATQFDIAVTVRTTEEKPGEYARYAERYLGIKDVITAESTQKEIVDVQITTRTVADPTHRYYLLPGSIDTKAKLEMPTLHLTKEGILNAVNTEPNAASSPSVPCAKAASACKKASCYKVYPTLTSEMLQASSTMKMAELAAKQVFTLRDTRMALLEGDLEKVPADGEALKLYLDELQNMEQSYTELFTGSHRETYETIHISYQPQATGKGETAFRFSSQKGVVPASDLSGSPVTLTVTPQKGSSVNQRLNTYPNPDRKSKVTSIEVPAGIYYYIPCQSDVEVSYNQQTFYHSIMSVAQAGNLMKLPATPTLKATFSPITGALQTCIK